MVRIRHSIPAFVMAAGLFAAPACAAQRPYYGVQRDYRDFERRADDEGYRRGADNGARDARDRRDFRIERDRDYRRGWGDRDEFRRFYQDGYRAGYADGFNRVAQYDRRSYRGPVYDGRYSEPGSQGRVFTVPAAQNGYRDGLRAGRDAANDRENYDPRREKWYRDGDHDYDNRYGPRDQYKQDYRAAFVQGYEDGYRGYRQ